MKKRKLLQDDFLEDLMKNVELESPSDDFSLTIMSRVEAMPAYRPHKIPVSSRIKSLLPWVLLAGACVVFYIFSDLPFGKYFPGGEFLRDMFLPYVLSFLSSIKSIASAKFYSIALAIFITACCLIGIERLISHRITTRRHFII